MSSTPWIDAMAEEIRLQLMNVQNDEARLEVLHNLNICLHCGADESKHPCYCMRDD